MRCKHRQVVHQTGLSGSAKLFFVISRCSCSSSILHIFVSQPLSARRRLRHSSSCSKRDNPRSESLSKTHARPEDPRLLLHARKTRGCSCVYARSENPQAAWRPSHDLLLQRLQASRYRVCVLVRGLSYLAVDCCRRRPSGINVLLYYVTEEQGSKRSVQGETGPRDIQMIIPLHQLRIPHIQDLEQYLSPSTTNSPPAW